MEQYTAFWQQLPSTSPANTLWALSTLKNIKYLVHKHASETHLRPFCVCLLLLIPSSGLFSLRFHGSAERAIASAGVEMQRRVAVGKHLALRLQEAGQGVGKGGGNKVVNRCAEDGPRRRRER